MRAAATPIAVSRLARVAVTPPIRAPMAYPESRQNRYMPSAVARQAGWAASLTAASRVG